MNNSLDLFWRQEIPELLSSLNTAANGLTSEDAEKRLEISGADEFKSRRKFGFVPLPLNFLVIMGIIVVLYIFAAEGMKKVFYKKFAEKA